MVHVYTLLMSSSPLVAIIGPRAYMDMAPQTSGLVTPSPYVIWSGMGGRTNPYLGDIPGIDNPVIIFEIYAQTAAQRESIYNAMIAVLDPAGNMLQQPMTFWDFESKLFKAVFEYSFWIGR